ncbi:MAG: AmmeMemoRadiSam system protein B [Candidatus Omnitrophica bacterium]|nr:AmmeMemoRadiSam system protein B [Candidatus Omnitrophota bacterium]
MTVRRAHVAGYFYPARKEELLRFLDETHEERAPHPAVAVLVPHAGYLYSGAVAAKTYSRAALPSRFLLIGPNHTGFGKPFSVMAKGVWESPLGRVPIDEALAKELLRGPWLEADTEAHSAEHALEVQIPFLQRARPEMSFVPVIIGSHDLEKLRQIGEFVGKSIEAADERPLLVISSDLNHYENEAITRQKDELAIAALEKLDENSLARAVQRSGVSMCGFAAAYVGLVAAKILGARRGKLIEHSTSAPVTGDFERVVGYAGMIFS